MKPLAAQAALHKALAHPTRLRILEALAREEACVCHLTALLHQRQAYISQHLMVLREAGLVEDRRDGVLVYYRLLDPRAVEVGRLLRGIAGENGASEPEETFPAAPLAGCSCPKCQGMERSGQ